MPDGEACWLPSLMSLSQGLGESGRGWSQVECPKDLRHGPLALESPLEEHHPICGGVVLICSLFSARAL